MPNHSSVVDRTRVTGHQISNVVPVIQDPQAPNIMDPALQSGLYNPNAYVRGGAVEAMGKTYGAQAMKKANREESDAKARVRHYVWDRANAPYTPGILTNEEQAAFDAMVKVEETATDEENVGEGEPAGLEKERGMPAIGAAAPEDMREEKTAEVEKEGAAGVAAGDAAGETGGETGGKNPAEKQKKKKQAKPAPLGTAWFLQRGKELGSKRTY